MTHTDLLNFIEELRKENTGLKKELEDEKSGKAAIDYIDKLYNENQQLKKENEKLSKEIKARAENIKAAYLLLAESDKEIKYLKDALEYKIENIEKLNDKLHETKIRLAKEEAKSFFDVLRKLHKR